MSAAADFTVNGWECTYARFGSSELAEIAGIPGAMQRLWKNRGFLPCEKTTRLQYTARDVAEIMVRHDLSKLGIAPGDSDVLGHFAAQTILWFALLSSDGACEVWGSVDATNAFLDRFERDETLANSLCGDPDADRYIVRAVGADPIPVGDLPAFLESAPIRSGSFLDLAQMSFDLVSRAQRPLVRVRLDKGSIRRLTGQTRSHLRLV